MKDRKKRKADDYSNDDDDCRSDIDLGEGNDAGIQPI